MSTKTHPLTANFEKIARHGLYKPELEHDACGVGVVANIPGNRSHEIIDKGLDVLKNLAHRGACGCDPETGDGAGILIQMPHEFFSKVAKESRINLPKAGSYAVGMTFLPREEGPRRATENAVEAATEQQQLKFLGWRNVPVNPAAIGTLSRQVMPVIKQFFIGAPDGLIGKDFEKKLYLVRKEAETIVMELAKARDLPAFQDFYVCSLSAKTVVYKGLIMAKQLRDFYPDLSDESTATCFAIVHSRFSTNTLGAWKLAHPYRMIAHNGEINTIRGNRNWMATREAMLKSVLFGESMSRIADICEQETSDTASFDNVFELLYMAGRDVEHAMSMMIPEAWYGHESMSKNIRDFYDFHSCLMEPWDGPALVAFTDGNKIGAVLDRNGLRPFRYTVMDDGLLVMASEVGVLDLTPERVVQQDRIRPGQMFLVDFEQGRIIDDSELKDGLASRQEYGRWIHDNRLSLSDLPKPNLIPGNSPETLTARQQVFGYSQEDLNILMRPMATFGEETVGSMGNDAPLAVLSEMPQSLFSYFKQLFAQVSNPPLDVIREQLVTQMTLSLGSRKNLLDESPSHCRLLNIDNPITSNHDLERIKLLDLPGLQSRVVSTLFKVVEGVSGFRSAVDRIRTEATRAVSEGCTILVLSDRGVNSTHSFIPSLLAASSIHHHLIREGKRQFVDIALESGEPREVHHFATLFGYGVSAINPYLAYETLNSMRSSPFAEQEIPDQVEAETQFAKAVTKGVLKVMSKMGISTLQGYHGAQVFEALGLSQEIIDEHFTWTATRVGGIGLDEIAFDVIANHKRAYGETKMPSELSLDIGGLYQWRETGETHMWNPDTITLLQHSVQRNDRDLFKKFEQAADNESQLLCTIRGLLDFDFDPSAMVPLEEVEPSVEIVKRFATGAISLGSISPEAHETLAIAMNSIDARSNTGEGGEDETRFMPHSNGASRSSRIKQVASGRFGVTANYLVNATDLQIKMAQGSKPGEGGQIPGNKITEYIGGVRRTTPGIELISPPPHHDIYSIEDLAQLIHDLKNINPEARVHVKLVAEVGVGIIAAGVSKGKADVVLISGDSGGTGASPLSSIKHAGLPWELGLAETQQVLVSNGLRGRISVQTDGQIKTTRDVAVAALLGADEWGIATGSLIAIGCIMLRNCHLNTCSVGIATQNPDLRKLFTGTPDALRNYFIFLAEGLRTYMAKLGFRTVDEMIGRCDKLRPRQDIKHRKARLLDLRPILETPEPFLGDTLHHSKAQDHGLETALNHNLIQQALPAIEHGKKVRAKFRIRNSDRAVGAMLSGKITANSAGQPLPDGTVDFTFIGSAGQSFGAFITKGISFRLQGGANDYLGKGLSGGLIVVLPPEDSRFRPDENVIIGNVALYGATGGEAYINGMAGERFCVRNSAASAVVEGIGDHGCEYMTGGCVVVLGPAGRNFGAGMTGGIAYALDADGSFSDRFNCDMADLEIVERDSGDEAELIDLIRRHHRHTSSPLAKMILMDWDNMCAKFRKITPREYAKQLVQRKTRVVADNGEPVRHG